MSAGQYTPGTEGPRDPAGNTGRSAEPAGQEMQSGQRGDGPRATGRATSEPRATRTGVIWAAVVAALVLLILLIIFILQNQNLVLVSFLGFEGSVPLGMALFIASVAGAVLVAAAGGARILQLRINAHRSRAAQRK